MSYGGLDTSKASAADHHTKASQFSGNGFTRNVGASALKVGRLAAESVKAFGKAIIGRDDFTQQVARQAKRK